MVAGHGGRDAPPHQAAHVVVVPGLGLTAYLRPLVRALELRGVRATVLDVPGHHHRRTTTPPTVQAIARATADALAARPPSERLLLLGHSTGAQAALQAALLVQGRRPVSGVVLAGPTVAPTQRRLDLLALTSGMAYRRDSPRELVVLPEVLRARLRLLTLLRSAIADRPERHVAALRSPLLLTAGRADSFSPPWWLEVLATGATRSPSVQVARLPGSHNNPYTHARALAELVTVGMLADP